MKYKLKYKSARAKAYHSFLFYLCFSAIAILPIIVIDLLFVIIFAIFAAEHLPITEQNIYDCAYFVLVIEIFISILIALKSNKRYVKIDSKGVLMHNSNTEHFGLGQRNRLNVIVPFERVVGCYIEIPVDCPDNYKYKKWIIAYFASNRYDITLRMADDITGPWSEPYKLVDSKEYPQLYGSFFHPLSSYGDELYFLMSMWKPYNVFLMKTKLFKK